MSKITASGAFTQMDPVDVPKYLSFFADDVMKQVNGGLDFSTNINCKLISAAFGSSNTDTTFQHTLGRVPAGYLVYGATAAMSVYDGSLAWTTSAITLKSSAIGTARLILI